MESLRTSLASRTHFEVLGLGLEASSPRKLPCPRLEEFLECLKFCRWAEKIFSRPFFFGDHLKKFFEDVFFWRTLAFVSLVLGLEHSCPWPRECLSSDRLSLALASDFFCVLGLGLEPCVLDSTSAEDAPRTGERNVNLNENTSENAAVNKNIHPNKFLETLNLSFILKFKGKERMNNIYPSSNIT